MSLAVVLTSLANKTGRSWKDGEMGNAGDKIVCYKIRVKDWCETR